MTAVAHTAAGPLHVQYDSLERQHTTARLGMWVFLGSESLLFAGLLALYAAYRFAYPVEFHAASAHANLVIGTVNTYVLLTSSLTVALAIHASRRGHRRRTVALLVATITSPAPSPARWATSRSGSPSSCSRPRPCSCRAR